MANNALPLPFPYLPGEQRPDSFEDRVQQNFDAVAVAVGQVVQGAGWQAPTFTNSWTNFSAGYTTAGYRVNAGIVHLRGHVRSGTVNSSIFTLPSALRPTARVDHPIVYSSGVSEVAGSVAILTTGAVVPTSAAGNSMVCLDGVSFHIS